MFGFIRAFDSYYANVRLSLNEFRQVKSNSE